MSTFRICPWELARRAELEASRSIFESATEFSALVAEAGSRGFRRATLFEQMDSRTDAYSWRGGVWVKAQQPANGPARQP